MLTSGGTGGSDGTGAASVSLGCCAAGGLQKVGRYVSANVLGRLNLIRVDPSPNNSHTHVP